MNNDNKIVSCFGLLAIAVIGVVVSAIMNGWVFSILWSWFILPLFDVPALSVVQAIGISMVVGALTKQYTKNNDENKDTLEAIATLIGYAVFAPLLTLAIAYVVKLFL